MKLVNRREYISWNERCVKNNKDEDITTTTTIAAAAAAAAISQLQLLLRVIFLVNFYLYFLIIFSCF